MISPSELAGADTFRIGCIGRINAAHMRGALSAVAEVLAELGIKSLKAAA